MRFSDRTQITSITPGAIVSSGWVMMTPIPSSIIVPQDASGGCTPAPRKDSAASSMTAFANSSGKNTSTVLSTLGRISPTMIRGPLAPCARAASTNSCSRRRSTSPRSGRAR